MLKTDYKFIRFSKIADKAKTAVWSCTGAQTRDELGIVQWFAAWRRYCYFPAKQTVYDANCLQDITEFVNQVNAEHKAT